MMKAAFRTQTKSALPPSFTPLTGGFLQRKCACGGSPGPIGECEACRKRQLQRKATGQALERVINSVAPPIVEEVLRSTGDPLDIATRAFMEARFGHDFSSVRVHTDASAAQSARAVNALAYAFGQHVVFGSAQYVPTTPAGRQLLAHELAHVIQQNGAAGLLSHDVISNPTDSAERDADRAAQAVTDNEPVPRLAPAATSIRRQRSRNDPQVPENHTTRTLTETERTTISQLTRNAAPNSPLAIPQGARFVLHDTAGAVNASYIQTQQRTGRGPLAETGSAAFVPATGPATIVRRGLFDPNRPSVTNYERGEDVMVQARRDDEYRNVWRATNPTERRRALDRALANQGLTAEEILAEQGAAEIQLIDNSFRVRTTGAWAVSEICRNIRVPEGRIALSPTLVAASPGVVNVLTAACERLAPLFAARGARIRSTVNVEMVQPEGSGWRTTGTLIRLPAYTNVQYHNVMLLYLQSALQVGRFPEITTHFWIDKNIGDHLDPRCFNLGRLYGMISAFLSHAVGSTYGITPNYGTGSAHNVWWNNTVCGGPHP